MIFLRDDLMSDDVLYVVNLHFEIFVIFYKRKPSAHRVLSRKLPVHYRTWCVERIFLPLHVHVNKYYFFTKTKKTEKLHHIPNSEICMIPRRFSIEPLIYNTINY